MHTGARMPRRKELLARTRLSGATAHYANRLARNRGGGRHALLPRDQRGGVGLRRPVLGHRHPPVKQVVAFKVSARQMSIIGKHG